MGACGEFWNVRKGLGRLIGAVKWLFLILALVIVLIIVAAVALDISGSAKLKAARAEAAARHLKLSMADLTAGWDKIDEPSNAANYYEAAVSLMRAKPAAPQSDYVPTLINPLYGASRYGAGMNEAARKAEDDFNAITADPRLPLPDYMLAATARYVSDRRDIVDLVAAAQPLSFARYHVRRQGPETDRSHLSGIRAVGRLMQLAAWLDAQEGRAAAAVQKIRQSLALAGSLEQEPDFLSSLVEMAVVAMTLHTGLTHAVARLDVPNGDLEALQKDIERFAAQYSIRAGLEGELAMHCDLLNAIIQGDSPLSAVQAVENIGLENPRESGLDRLPVWPLKGYLKAEEALGIRFFVGLLDNCDDPGAEVLNRTDPIIGEIHRKPYRHFIAGKLLPAWSSAILQAEQTRARLRAAAAALAALRFRNDTARWPDSLDALVPGYLDVVPRDPFTGKALLYFARPEGVIVYSVGVNRADDRGKGPGLLPYDYMKERCDDVGFRAWR